MEEKVVEIIANALNKNKDQITMSTRFVEDLGADSLDVIELIMVFEDEMGITLPDNAAGDLKTVGDIVNYIKNLKK